MYKSKHPQYFELVCQKYRAILDGSHLANAKDVVFELQRDFGGEEEGREAGAFLAAAATAAMGGGDGLGPAQGLVPPGSRFAFPALEVALLLERRRARQFFSRDDPLPEELKRDEAHFACVALAEYPLADRLLTYKSVIERLVAPLEAEQRRGGFGGSAAQAAAQQAALDAGALPHSILALAYSALAYAALLSEFRESGGSARAWQPLSAFCDTAISQLKGLHGFFKGFRMRDYGLNSDKESALSRLNAAFGALERQCKFGAHQQHQQWAQPQPLGGSALGGGGGGAGQFAAPYPLNSSLPPPPPQHFPPGFSSAAQSGFQQQYASEPGLGASSFQSSGTTSNFGIQWGASSIYDPHAGRKE